MKDHELISRTFECSYVELKKLKYLPCPEQVGLVEESTVNP
jgi:hypothetical protein